MAGILYVVSTPIGNLEDLTHRGARLLAEVSVIACEDTRQTRKLLGHYGIATPTLSYHEHNEAERTEELLRTLERGDSVALVSDAGTPLVSDPGYRLVKRAAEAGISVVPVPGPSAPLAALAAAGLPTDAFYFGGFLPPRSGQRRKRLQELASLEATLVFFEAPHRMLETLEDIEAALGVRQVVLARELTKIHEEFLRGTGAGLRTILAGRGSLKGEFTVLIAKADRPSGALPPPAEAAQAAIDAGMDRMSAIKQTARQHGLSKREVYRLIQEKKDVT